MRPSDGPPLLFSNIHAGTFRTGAPARPCPVSHSLAAAPGRAAGYRRRFEKDITGRHCRVPAFSLIENKPLARSLHAVAEIDEQIPYEHWQAVAEIIGYVMDLQRNVPRDPPQGSALRLFD